MKRTLTDFSQLTKSMIKPSEPVAEPKPEKPQPSGFDRSDEEVLAYFSRPGDRAAAKPPVCARAGMAATVPPSASGGDPAALSRQLGDAEAARKDAEDRLAESDRRCADLAAELANARKELARLQGDCGRLKGELRKAQEAAPVREEPKAEPSSVPARPTPTGGVLAAPGAFAEAFPGELREMVLSVLSDARDAAVQSTRERRAAVLGAVLAANRPTGELDRRRTELKQIMKDAGYYTDPRALEELGFKLVSGRTHWKLEYAGVRMPIAKTPSDYRANLNMAADMANKCF